MTLWNVTDLEAVSHITTFTRKDPGAGDVALSPDGRSVAGAAPDGSYMVRL